MTAITKAQLDAASLDAESLALFTNGAADEDVLTRLGATYPTVKKLVSDIYTNAEYSTPIPYVSGISLTTPNQTVDYNDIVYAPIQSQLPFTTSGTFETAKFRVIQGVMFADLAAPDGASKIGVTQIGTGAIPRTLQDKARENISASDYSTIQQAITAAGASGSVTIPASYAGTDAYTTDENIPITDLRHKQTGFWSRIGPSYPVNRYPFGNDAVLLARGAADLYIEHFHVEATTTVTLNVGLNTNVPISAVTCGNKRFPADSGTGGAEMFSEFAQLFIGRETENEEQVNQGSWSIVDATHINITCTKTHTGITDIDQGGSTLLNSQDLYIGSNVVKPSQNTTYSAPLRVKDLGGRIIAKVPSNIDDIFPHSMWQWGAVQSGLYGVNRDLRYKQSLSTSKVIWGNFDNVEIASLNNAGAYKVLGGLAAGEGQMTLNGVNAEVKIGRNVDGRAITSPVDCHVVFQDGSDPLNPSLTAGSLLLSSAIVGSVVNFAPQNVWSGSLGVNGLKLKTGFGCNNKAPQAAAVSGGTLAGVIAALVANGILSS